MIFCKKTPRLALSPTVNLDTVALYIVAFHGFPDVPLIQGEVNMPFNTLSLKTGHVGYYLARGK